LDEVMGRAAVNAKNIPAEIGHHAQSLCSDTRRGYKIQALQLP
jgi:hypothetical protein